MNDWFHSWFGCSKSQGGIPDIVHTKPHNCMFSCEWNEMQGKCVRDSNHRKFRQAVRRSILDRKITFWKFCLPFSK